MRADDAGELHHVDRFFGAEDFGKLGVGDDEPLVFGVLQVVLFDVIPEFFGHFGAGKLRSLRRWREVLWRELVAGLGSFCFVVAFL